MMTPERIKQIEERLNEARKYRGRNDFWARAYHSDVAPLLAALRECRLREITATSAVSTPNPVDSYLAAENGGVA